MEALCGDASSVAEVRRTIRACHRFQTTAWLMTCAAGGVGESKPLDMDLHLVFIAFFSTLFSTCSNAYVPGFTEI